MEIKLGKEIMQQMKRVVFPEIQPQERLGIIKYDGWEGIRRIYLEVLEEAIQTKSDIYALENNIPNSEIGELFIEEYVNKRIENNVIAHVICPQRAEDKDYKSEYQSEHTKIKLIENLPIDANINVVGDLVMSFSTKPLHGTLRRNKAEANTWRIVLQKLLEQN